jgi:predicted PurR-regulated permease PerM
MSKRDEPADKKAPMRLTSDTGMPALSAVEIGSYLVACASMFLVLRLQLLGALLAGMLVYQVVCAIAPVIGKTMRGACARWIAVVIVAVAIVGGLTGLTVVIIDHVQGDIPGLQKLLDQMMMLTSRARLHLPEWVANYLPVDAGQTKSRVSALMQSNAGMLQQDSKSAASSFGDVLIGMIVGAIIAVGVPRSRPPLPLSAVLLERVAQFSEAFRRIVFAQLKISAINTVFAALYLLVALPIFHERLPLSNMLLLVTFIVGLLPVIGNLVSNAIIVAISLWVSFGTAVASLVFLILIHKLEYLLNAWIIGSQIGARTWELLLAMLAMGSAFGVPGVVAAPIFYAYIRRELMDLELV